MFANVSSAPTRISLLSGADFNSTSKEYAVRYVESSCHCPNAESAFVDGFSYGRTCCRARGRARGLRSRGLVIACVHAMCGFAGRHLAEDCERHERQHDARHRRAGCFWDVCDEACHDDAAHAVEHLEPPGAGPIARKQKVDRAQLGRRALCFGTRSHRL